MKKILIPIDTKFNSHYAIDYAIRFFEKEDCHFYLLNTYSYDVNGLDAMRLLQEDEDYFDKPKHDSENYLGSIIEKYTLNNQNDRHHFNAISVCTNLIDGIKINIKNLDINLVLLSGQNQDEHVSERYSKNTMRILDSIRECPVMIVPESSDIKREPKFLFVSNFEMEIPKNEIQTWYELVTIANGSIKILTLTEKNNLTKTQKIIQDKVNNLIEKLSNQPIEIDYLETLKELKNYTRHHSDYVICLIDRKPDLFQKWGLTHSKITNLGPLPNAPLIALHR